MAGTRPLLWIIPLSAALAVLLGPTPSSAAEVAAAESANLTAGCVFEGGFPDLLMGQAEGRLDFKQGGLGNRATSEYKVWVCIRPHPCALTDLE